ncbi:serine hydrolase domain-containing protein [Georgenia sunbinii]|uniref:serine hydrolase domain-containing protein n=1 Tax=Georgenia sunbinii TaxID=3117728 RepID=UPI002F269871
MTALREFPFPQFPHAVVVTGPDEVRWRHGEVQQTFRWASVTKLLSATAALVAVERHLVDLDAAAGPDGATVRHLLAHASGVAMDSDKTLGPPERRRIYSNRGIELLADHVADATGTPFEEWLEDTVLVPLGLSSVVLDGSPAHGATGHAEDLAAFGRELLRPTLISADLHRAATTVAFPGLTGVLPGFGRQDPNDWGLGFEIRGSKSPHWTGSGNSPATFGHFGQSGSFLWVDPAADLAAAFLGAEAFGPWAAELWPGLGDAILTELA